LTPKELFINKLSLNTNRELIVYLRNEETTINVKEFSDKHFAKELSGPYIKFMSKNDLKTSFMKNNKYLDRNLKTRTIKFKDKIKFTAPEEAFEREKISIKEREDKTIIEIKGTDIIDK